MLTEPTSPVQLAVSIFSAGADPSPSIIHPSPSRKKRISFAASSRAPRCTDSQTLSESRKMFKLHGGLFAGARANRIPCPSANIMLKPHALLTYLRLWSGCCPARRYEPATSATQKETAKKIPRMRCILNFGRDMVQAISKTKDNPQPFVVPLTSDENRDSSRPRRPQT